MSLVDQIIFSYRIRIHIRRRLCRVPFSLPVPFGKRIKIRKHGINILTSKSEYHHHLWNWLPIYLYFMLSVCLTCIWTRCRRQLFYITMPHRQTVANTQINNCWNEHDWCYIGILILLHPATLVQYSSMCFSAHFLLYCCDFSFFIPFFFSLLPHFILSVCIYCFCVYVITCFYSLLLLCKKTIRYSWGPSNSV